MKASLDDKKLTSFDDKIEKPFKHLTFSQKFEGKTRRNLAKTERTKGKEQQIEIKIGKNEKSATNDRENICQRHRLETK